MEERFASNELGMGSSPIGGPNYKISDFGLRIADLASPRGKLISIATGFVHERFANPKSEVCNPKFPAEVM